MTDSTRALPRTVRGDLQGGGAVRWTRVHQGALLEATRWRCQHEDDAMRSERCHTDWVLVLLSSGACRVHDGTRSALVDPASAMLHRPDRPYRTTHPFGCDDAGWSFALRRDVAEEVLPAPLRSAPGPAFEVRARRLRNSLDAFVAAERRRLRIESDSLELDEAGVGLFGQLFACDPHPGRARRRSTSARHRRLAERVREYLAATFREPMGLDQIAAAAGASPAHTSRVFHGVTGTTIHGYRLQLRLACALDAVLRDELPLVHAAIAAGFSSHGHLSMMFRRETGRTPVAVRAALHAPPPDGTGRRWPRLS